MDFLFQRVRSLLQAIEQRLHQWTKPNNPAPVLEVALSLSRLSQLSIAADGVFGQDKYRL